MSRKPEARRNPARPAPERGRARAWSNPWVLGWIGLVVTVLIANAIMIVLAVTTSPGLVVEDYYERGRNHAEALARHASEAELGWRIELIAPERVALGLPSQWQVLATDGQGLPLRAAEVQVHAYRPADARRDFSVQALEVEAGRYRAELHFGLRGVWDLVVEVRREGHPYRLARRVTVADG